MIFNFHQIKKKTMKFLLTTGAFLILALFSCNSGGEQKQSTSTMQEQPKHEAEEANKFKDVVFDSQKDFVCGMPISAGVSDTAHYKEKVYGFCSKECKDEFAKNPASFVAQK